MSMKYASQPAALAAAIALALGSSAYAQTMVGSQEVSEQDLPRVTEHCASLSKADEGAADADAGGPATDDIEADDYAADVDTEAMDDAADDKGAAEGATAENAQDNASGELDLDAITAADCSEAGLATN